MLKLFIQDILEGREWSWSVIGILAVVAGLILRSLLLSDILHRIKKSNRKWYKRVQTFYERRSLIGWGFFIAFVVGSMLIWRFERFFVKYMELEQWLLILVIFLVLSLFSHLRSYARSMIDAVQEQLISDKEL